MEMPRVKPSGATDALVGDLTSFTSKQITSGLENIDVSFTCKVCSTKAETLQDLLVHLNGSNCISGGAQGSLPCSQKEQRPSNKKEPLPHPTRSGSATKNASGIKSSVGKVIEDAVPSSRRVTRISSGSIKRKTAAEILGVNIKEEPSSDVGTQEQERVPSQPPLKRGRGRPRKNREGSSCGETQIQKKQQSPEEQAVSAAGLKPRGRGRPRKSPLTPRKDATGDVVPGAEESWPENVLIKQEVPDVEQCDLDLSGKSSVSLHPDKRKVQSTLASKTPASHAKKPKIHPTHAAGKAGGESAAKPMLPRSPPSILRRLVKNEAESNTRTIKPPKIIWNQPPQEKSDTAGKGLVMNKATEEHLRSLPQALNGDELLQRTEEEADVIEPTSLNPELDPHTGVLCMGGVPVQTSAEEDKDAQVKTEDVQGNVALDSFASLPKSETDSVVNSMQIFEAEDTVGEPFRIMVKEVDGAELQQLSEVPEDLLVAMSDGTVPPSLGEAATGPGPSMPRAKWKHERKFRCSLCKSRGFSTKEQLDLHLECHVEQGLGGGYRCPKCAFPVPQWTRMLYHLLTHSEYYEKLQGSEMMRNMLGKFECPICAKVFDKKVNFTCHYRKIHFKKSRVCDICGQSIVSGDIKTFHRHVEKCKKILYKCDECEYTTTISSNMKQHLKLHSGEGYDCHVCNRRYSSKTRLRLHMQIHDANRPLTVCDQCGKHFKTTDAVKKHILRFHTEPKQMYKCGVCGYTTKMELDLKKHMKFVHNKKFRCDHCTFQTNQESAFDSHMVYHLPDRIHPCPYAECFYRACTTKQLADHLSQVHNIKSKHQCPLCLKYYKKRTHLLRHLVSHTGEKAYHCLDCGMEFVSHSSYYRHRNKTGHDAKREGVVSVPQNITIQYIEETTAEEPKQGSPQKTSVSDPAGQQQVRWEMQEMGQVGEAGHILDASAQEEGAAATDMITQVMSAEDVQNQGEQVLEEICVPPIATVAEDGTISVQPNIHVTVEEAGDDHKPILVPTTYTVGEEGSETIQSLQIPESKEVPDSGPKADVEEAPQVIYVVKNEDGTVVASSEQQLGDEVITLEQPGAVQEAQHVAPEEMSLEELMGSTHRVVVQEEGGNVALVEIAGGTVELQEEQRAAEGSGDYNVVFREVQVPEAALSMLQLQSGQK